MKLSSSPACAGRPNSSTSIPDGGSQLVRLRRVAGVDGEPEEVGEGGPLFLVSVLRRSPSRIKLASSMSRSRAVKSARMS
jgi:hypothetical protein